LNDIHQGKWNGLGGKFEPGETPEMCAIREVKEEAGFDVHHLILKGFLTFPKFAHDEDWYVFVFVADQFDGDLVDSSEGTLAWWDDDRLLTLDLWAGDRIFLPLLDEPGFFSARFDYVAGDLVDYEVYRY
jgi:8-oxo-dGTP diphosphatase